MLFFMFQIYLTFPKVQKKIHISAQNGDWGREGKGQGCVGYCL